MVALAMKSLIDCDFLGMFLKIQILCKMLSLSVLPQVYTIWTHNFCNYDLKVWNYNKFKVYMMQTFGKKTQLRIASVLLFNSNT